MPDPPPTPLVVRDDMGDMLVVLPDNHAAAILASRSGSAPEPNEDVVVDACLPCCCCCWYCCCIEFGDDEPLSPMSPSSKDLALSERPLLLLFALPPRATTGEVLATLASHVFILPRELRLVPVGGLLPDPVRWGGGGLDDIGDDGLSDNDGGGGAPNSRLAAPPRAARPPPRPGVSSDRAEDGGDMDAS